MNLKIIRRVIEYTYLLLFLLLLLLLLLLFLLSLIFCKQPVYEQKPSDTKLRSNFQESTVFH